MSQDGKQRKHDFDTIYWQLKSLFPGDPEFTLANYPHLPYSYVLIAIDKGFTSRQHALHEMERPVAQLTSLTANLQRDAKKTKPYKFDDFCFYMPRDSQDLPDGAYGAAAVALVKRKLMPTWALFCFTQLASTADPDYVPDLLAFIAEDAILLHPVRKGAGYEGLLIAQESSSEQVRVFHDQDGKEITLTVPHIHTKVIAEEGAVLTR